MVMWKDPTPAAKPDPARFEPPAPAAPVAATPSPPPARPATPEGRESVIAADLAIEGKIEGSGHVRIAGKFKGDIKVQGNLAIDQGAKVAGGISANKVTVAGELEGNIASAQQVDLLPTAAVQGDIKAGSLTVASGSRIRGQVDCGWGKDEPQSRTKAESGERA